MNLRSKNRGIVVFLGKSVSGLVVRGGWILYGESLGVFEGCVVDRGGLGKESY